MSDLSVYIVEDEALYSNELEMLIDDLGYQLLGISDNSDEAKEAIDTQKPDLVLMDVKINGSMNGIDLAAAITHQPAIIFITSFNDQATFDRAKETKPYAFLTKPFDATHLQRTIELAFNSQKETEWNSDVAFENSFFVKNRNRLEKIQIEDVLYLEVEDRYSTVYTIGGKKYVLRMSMGEVMDRLPTSMFLRIHRKYTVNLKKITSIDTQDNMIRLDELELPISRSHKEELLKKLDWLQ